MRFYLLNSDDIHEAGDEIWIDGFGWKKLTPIHFGDIVGSDSNPCRRIIPPEIIVAFPPGLRQDAKSK